MSIQHPFEEKLHIVLRHHDGASIKQLSIEYHVCEKTISHWIGLYNHYGENALKKQPNRHYSPDFKVMVVADFLEKDVSLFALQMKHRLNRGTIQSWARQVKRHGYESLHIAKKRGRSPKTMSRPKKKAPVSELEKLQADNAKLRAEVALLKKVRALVLEEENQQRNVGSKPSKR